VTEGSDDDIGAEPWNEERIKHVFWNIESMAFPPSREEADLLSRVLELPRVTVSRPDERRLLAMGMIPYNCHVNCAEFASSEKDSLTRHIWGWIIHGSDLILHSVVERQGHWRCLTPQYIKVSPDFTFIPDMAIEWVDTADGIRQAYRNGKKLPDALRRYPEDHILMRDKFRDLVASGMSPLDAQAQVASTLDVEHGRRLARTV
jgi:hypothetical protein